MSQGEHSNEVTTTVTTHRIYLELFGKKLTLMKWKTTVEEETSNGE
jgi:hypothetical protein